MDDILIGAVCRIRTYGVEYLITNQVQSATMRRRRTGVDLGFFINPSQNPVTAYSIYTSPNGFENPKYNKEYCYHDPSHDSLGSARRMYIEFIVSKVVPSS
jgi:hypothetical protein